jgi:hypothetical protein
LDWYPVFEKGSGLQQRWKRHARPLKMRGVIGQRSQPVDQAGGDVREIKKRIELRQHEHTCRLMTSTSSGMSGIEWSG